MARAECMRVGCEKTAEWLLSGLRRELALCNADCKWFMTTTRYRVLALKDGDSLTEHNCFYLPHDWRDAVGP